jgi:Flp pilus assembly protein TadB
MRDDEAGRRKRPRPTWSRRYTPEEVRDADDFRTQNALVKFYAVIPLMIVAAFLPAGPLQGIWMALVIVGYAVWGIRHVMRSSLKRTVSEEARAASADDGGEPPVADPSR